MASLTINGWPVPVADPKADLSDDEVGSQQRAASGNLIATRNAIRAKGDFETPLTDPQTVNALRELIRGRGDRFPFTQFQGDDGVVLGTADLGNGLYTGKGLYPTTLQGCAARGVEFRDVSLYHPHFHPTCLAIEDATTNYLPAASADCSDASGFTAIGSTSLTHYGSGAPGGPKPPLPQADCIGATTSSGMGPTSFKLASVPVDSGVTYVFSAYVLAGAVGQSVTIELVSGAFVLASQSMSITANGWTRLSTSLSFVGSALDLRLTLGGDGTFYTAGWQFEKKTENAGAAFATSWSPGGGPSAATPTRAAPELKYTLNDLRGVDDLTVMGWMVREVMPAAGGSAYLWYLGEGTYGSGNEATVWSGSDRKVHFSTGDELTYTPAIDLFPLWHHWAFTIRRTQTGAVKTIYRDGAQVAQGSTTFPCAWGDYPSLFLGTSNSFGQAGNILLQELVVLPMAATPSMISAWYSRQFSNLPLLSVGGDGLFGLDSAPLTCIGKAGKLTQQSAALGGTPANTARKLAFTLNEI